MRGQLHQAADHFKQAIAEGNAPGIGMANLALSELFYEWNLLDTAAVYIRQGLTISTQRNNVITQVFGYRLWARLQQVYGYYESANEAMRTAHQLADTHQFPVHLRKQNAEWELLLALNRHDLTGVKQWFDPLSMPTNFHPLHSLIYSRALIVLEQRKEASKYLSQWLPIAIQEQQRYAVIAILIQQALAAVYVPHPLIIDALTLAKKEQFMRIFLDAAPGIVPLLHAAVNYPATAVYAEELLTAAKQSPETDLTGHEPVPYPPPAESLSSLTGPEMQLLRLLMSGKNYQEIAGRLNTPYHTVKREVDRLHHKLGMLTTPGEVKADRDQ